MKRRLSPRAITAAVVAGFVVTTFVGYRVLVSPKRSEAASLERQIDQTQDEIARARAASLQADRRQVRVADLVRVAKAIPARVDVPGVLLELNGIAARTGIVFESFAPQAPVAASGYQIVPIEVVFQGHFDELAELLHRLRSGVAVRRGKLRARGRLFAVDALDFAEGDAKFPQIRATMTVNAFVYGAAPGGGAAGAAGPGGSGTAAGTQAPGEAPPPSGASETPAAGAQPTGASG